MPMQFIGRFYAYRSLLQHVGLIGSHPHSPGFCIGRSIIFTVLVTSEMFMLGSIRTAALMMQFRTYFWRFRQCQLNFMPFACTLHAAVAFSRTIFSALDSCAASAAGRNAMPLINTVAIVPAIKAVAKWYTIPSFNSSSRLVISSTSGRLTAGAARRIRKVTRRRIGQLEMADYTRLERAKG
jgi:hypothetical protein